MFNSNDEASESGEKSVNGIHDQESFSTTPPSGDFGGKIRKAKTCKEAGLKIFFGKQELLLDDSENDDQNFSR